MSKVKTNPRNKPMSKADIDRAIHKVKDEAINTAIAVIFTALVDKEGWTVEQLEKLYQEVQYISDSINQGYVKISDLKHTLTEEYNIKFKPIGK